MRMIARHLISAVFPLLLGSAALAQAPLDRVLPDTTVLAMHVAPDGFDPAALEAVMAELDVPGALDVIERLVRTLAGAADAVGLDELRDLDVLAELTAECPALASLARDSEGAVGPMAIGVSISRFDPEPALVFAVRPAGAGMTGEVVDAVVDCLDGRVLGVEGGVPLWLLGDGGDLPLLVADAGDTLAVASDPEVLRGMIRRAAGADEPGFADTRVGRLSGDMTTRGLALSVNLAAGADVLELLRPMTEGEPGADAIFDRLLNTLRVVNGFTLHASLSADGLLLESVATFDATLASEVGEEELLELLTCATCDLSEPVMLPRDAVAVSGGTLRLGAFVAWLDTWLDGAAQMGAVPEGWDTRSAMSELLGVDADTAVLGWLGDSWHAATLDVLATDMGAWLRGLPTIVTLPVTSEVLAREGVATWPTVLSSIAGLAQDLSGDTDLPESMRMDEAVSVRHGSYRGVEYTRYRAGFGTDVGVAVFGGHLVIGSPVGSLHEAIDVYLGAVRLTSGAWRAVEALDVGAGPVRAYEATATADFLRGLAEASDLASGPFATAMWVAVQGALAAEQEDATADAPTDAPTYDELIGLADRVTDGLRLLAERTGPAVGTTELEDGVLRSTWRLPLR